MLAIPGKGMSWSVDAHNVLLDVLCDWIEGSILFDDEELSASDVVDTLCDGEIYEDQNFAWERVEDAWRELRRRHNWLGNGHPLKINSLNAKRKYAWRESAAHSFCIALSLAKWYPDWARSFGQDFTKQGELFETLTKESLQKMFSGWEIDATGWTRTKTQKLHKVVSKVAERLGEPIGSKISWTRPEAKDAGLDLLCYRPFPDGRVGIPVYLMQCASGANWKNKTSTPNVNTWRNLIQFTSEPKKAFATPFALLDDEFKINCLPVNGLLIDRYRLLSPARDNLNWVSMNLQKDLIKWLRPRINKLPKANK